MEILLLAVREMPDASLEVIIKVEATEIMKNIKFMYPNKRDNWIMWKTKTRIIKKIRGLYSNYLLQFNVSQMITYTETTAIFDFNAFPKER